MRVLAPVLVVSGLALAVAGALHPHVPAAPVGQSEVFATDAMWAPSHWVLTFSQLAGATAIALLRARRRAAAAPLVDAGMLLAVMGLVVGALGTLLAATALVEAARSGDVALFATTGASTMAIGWTCLVVAALGGALAGLGFLRGAGPRLERLVGGVALVGCAAFLVAAIVVPPQHVWTHEHVLRFGAIGFGLLLAVSSGLARERRGPPAAA